MSSRVSRLSSVTWWTFSPASSASAWSATGELRKSFPELRFGVGRAFLSEDSGGAEIEGQHVHLVRQGVCCC